MSKKKRLSRAISAAIGFTLSVSGSAFAQDEEAFDDETVLEEVIVTGSRLDIKDGFGRTSPVTVVGMEDIRSYGFTRIEDMLVNLPQVEVDQNAFIANGFTGTASIGLRGLGAKRVLNLFNSRRMQPGGFATVIPDINQIPSSMVERVEILTGGASATYGADAVAGVVNFIMRRVTGVEVNASVSGYQHDNRNKYIRGLADEFDFDYPTGSTGIDGKSYSVDIVMGGDFAEGRGNATAYATWRESEELLQGTRDYSSCALDRLGTSCSGSFTTPVPFFDIYPYVDGEPDYNQYAFLKLLPDGSLGDIDLYEDRYNYAPISHYMRPNERWSIGAFVDYEINQHAIAYLETNFANNSTTGQIAESGTFYNDYYVLPLDNSLFPEVFRNSLRSLFPDSDLYEIYIGKRNVEGGPRASNASHEGFRIVTGLKGVITDNWDYELYYLYAGTSSSQEYINDLLAPNIAKAVNGETCAADPDCVPYEVFTWEGVTPEAVDYISGTAIMTAGTATSVINGYARGDLGIGLPSANGNINVVAGFEFRTEEYDRVSDTVFATSALSGILTDRPSLKGKYTVDELFFEANVPLLSDFTFAQQLSLDLAYRWSDYSTFGRTNTYRAGLVWQTVDWLRVRMGYNRAVRVPNFVELYAVQSDGGGPGDPCSGSEPDYSFEQCARTGVTADQYGNIKDVPAPPGRDWNYVNSIYGGNPDLGPETADTYTFGLVIDATDNMQLSFDYWNIKIEDVIDRVAVVDIFEECAFYNSLCSRIHRTDTGSLWRGDGYVDATNINFGEAHHSGIDAAFAWSVDALGGSFRTNLVGTYVLKRETTFTPNDEATSVDCAGLINARCFPSPKWRHTASVAYDSHSFWAVTARWRFLGKVKYERAFQAGPPDLIAGDNLGGQSYFDLNAVFRFMGTHDVVLGVNNILDKEPPLVGGSLSTNGNTIAGFYPTLGRYLFANVTLRW